jgi:transcription elongation factor Elf1
MPAKTTKADEKKRKAITFKCPTCQQIKTLDEMVVVTRFFPELVVCRNCEKTL